MAKSIIVMKKRDIVCEQPRRFNNASELAIWLLGRPVAGYVYLLDDGAESLSFTQFEIPEPYEYSAIERYLQGILND